MRNYSNVAELAEFVTGNLAVLHAAISGNAEAEVAYAQIEWYVAVSLRVIGKSNPSKVRDAARTEWIKGLIEGKPAAAEPGTHTNGKGKK